MWQFACTARMMSIGVKITTNPPTVEGSEPPPLTAGVQFSVEYENNVRDGGHVIDVDGDTATFELKDKSKWRMERNADGTWFVSEKVDSPAPREDSDG